MLVDLSPAPRTVFGTKYGPNNDLLNECIVGHPITGCVAWENNSSINNANQSHFGGAFYVFSASRARQLKQKEGETHSSPASHSWLERARNGLPGILAAEPLCAGLGEHIILGASAFFSLLQIVLFLRILSYPQHCMSLCFTILPTLLMVFTLSFRIKTGWNQEVVALGTLLCKSFIMLLLPIFRCK